MKDLFFEHSAIKSLKKIPAIYRTNIKKQIIKLRDFPENTQELGIKKLSGQYKNIFRMRVGKYRVLFQIKSDKIIIWIIKHRKEVY